ncbi:MAG: hypothetical protein IKQ77_03650 [Prevotella sp.]|nr:hypothetical protein [Prevotella sp.]
MRFAKLLLLGAVLLLGSSAAKAVDDNVWAPPAAPAEYASMVDGETYYFYNVGSNMFFTQGNAWGTQASVGHKGLKVKIESVEGAEGVYHLTDYCESKSAWLWVFFDNAENMFVDYNGQANHLWEITDVGAQTYRFSPSALNPDVNNNLLYLGLNRTNDPNTTVLTANNTAEGGAFINWKLVPEAYGESFFTEEYINYCNLYDAVMQLKDLLNKAESIGASVADQIAVYNNTNSTLAEINAAIAAVKEAIQNREAELILENYANATVNNPVDVTKLFIKNPSFDGNDITTGWKGTAWGAYNGQENAEQYSKEYDTYQDFEGLLEGVYKLKANAFYRAGNADPAYQNYKAGNKESKYAKLYATNGTDSITTDILSPFSAGLTAQMSSGAWSSATDAETGETFWIPNNMVAADEFFKAGYCNDNEVYIAVSNGYMKIGARKDITIGGDWSIFDDFSLTYFGDSGDAYKLILDNIELADYSNLEDIYTYSYLDAYNEAAAAIQSASTKEEIMAAIAAVQKASKDLETNIALWKQIISLRDEAYKAAASEDYIEFYRTDCGEWADFDCEDLLEARTATNEELEAEIAKVRAMIDEVYRHPIGSEVDMTNLMVNPNFTQYGDGWTREAASGGNVTAGGLADNPCYEAWNNANFDIYQNVQNAPKGVYRISVQGFYRYGRTAFQAYLNGEQYTTKETCPVFVYMNANTTPFTNVYGDPMQIYDAEFYSSANDATSEQLPDGTTVYFPNGMQSASVAFGAGMYTQSAYGLVANDGDVMRIGVKGSSNQLGDSWSIWDNFKITWCGFKADVVKPVLEQAIIDAENALNGAIGKDVVGDLQAAIDAAKAVVNGDDGEAMFAALTRLFDIQEAVNESKALFAKLVEANEELASALGGAVCSADIIREAEALITSINDGLENHTFSNSDVEGLLEQINTMMHRLGIPQDMANASDASPIECSTIIINPAYAAGNDQGWTGGAAVNATSCDAEKFNTNFDYFQVLSGLPEGTYRVVVQGFYRAGLADVDYNSWVENPAANNNAFLYAAAGEDTVSVALKRLCTEALVMEGLSDGWIYCNEEAMLAVPNSMTTGGDAFCTYNSEGTELLYSGNNVVTKVGEDGKLVIGLKKDVLINSDWTLWTNWQLFYYGKNSNLQPSDNPLSIEQLNSGSVVSREFFTVNGTRTNGLQKGVNIVRETMNDGTVRVMKVSVK